ncbi:MAG: head-tail connector protein [Rickettsiaceae bacterium]|nr:head-tail connector protein [Rickettsiaceae bacterium]
MRNMDIISTKIVQEKVINLEEAKSYLRVVGDHDDGFISSLIEASISFAESYIRKDIAKKEIIAQFSLQENDVVEINAQPIYAINYIKIAGGDSAILEEGRDYKIYQRRKVAFAKHIRNCDLEISYISGMSRVEHNIKQAILIYLGLLYDKEIISTNAVSNVYLLLLPHKTLNI